MPKAICFKPEGKKIYFQFVIVGAGGTGSNFVREFSKDIHTYLNGVNPLHEGVPFYLDILLVDGDKVSQSNLRNQVFTADDVDEYKVSVLAERYGDHYNIPFKRVTEYVTDMGMLQRLMPRPDDAGSRVQTVPVLIGLVDNNRTRQLLHSFFHSEHLENLIYIDAGIEDVAMNERKEQTLKDEERRSILMAGFGGQCVTGLKWGNNVYLPPVGDVYRNILEDEESMFPTTASCGEVIQSNPQRAATNRMAAFTVNNIVNNLFHSYSIWQHSVNFNAQFGGSRPTFVPDAVVEAFEAEVTRKK